MDSNHNNRIHFYVDVFRTTLLFVYSQQLSMETPQRYVDKDAYGDGCSETAVSKHDNLSHNLNASLRETRVLVVSQSVGMGVTEVAPSQAPASYGSDLGLSAFVLWCCCCPIGMIAWVYAGKYWMLNVFFFMFLLNVHFSCS